MNRSKKLYILLGVLAVVCLGTFGISRYEEHKEQIKNSDEIVLEVPGEDVTSLSWKTESASFAFHKDETWLYDEDEAFPVSEDKISELLEVFQSFGASFTIEDVEDYSQYGLDDPVCTIEIGTDDETYEISLGDYSTMDEQRYVSIGDGNVYLVQEDPLDSYDVELKDMIQNDEVPDLEDADSIQFAGAEDYTVTYKENSGYSYSDDDVYFAEQDGEYLPLDTSTVKSYLNMISNLSMNNYVTYNATEEELAQYGLDDPDLTVTVEYTVQDEETEEETTETFVLNIAQDPEEKEAAENSASDGEDESEEITAYARVGDSQIIYTITGTSYEDLMSASYDDLRHQEIFWADTTDIYQVDISLEGTDYTLTSKEEDGETVWYYGEEKIEMADFKSDLTTLGVTEFTDQEASGKEEISLTIYLNNDNYPEVKIGLYRNDGSSCVAVVDGETVALVDRSDVVELVEAVNAIVLE